MMIPSRPRWLSLLTLFYGLTLFLWMTPEDNNVASVTSMGVLLAVVVALNAVFRFGHNRFPRWLTLTALGALTGGGAALGTAALMFLKTAIHAHIFPDYPPLLMLGMLERLPAWTLAGALIGMALSLAIPTKS